MTMYDRHRPGEFSAEVWTNMEGFGYSLRLGWIDKPAQRFGLVKPLEIEIKQAGELAEPCFHMLRPEATAIMDALWRAGIRPSNTEGGVGQIGAMETNMGDLRSERDFLRQLVKGIAEAST